MAVSKNLHMHACIASGGLNNISSGGISRVDVRPCAVQLTCFRPNSRNTVEW